jgi:DNA-binding MarR family transcriptional regulator
LDGLTDLGDNVADAVFGFRRVTRRVVGRSFAGDPLPPSEAELLGFVRSSKGCTVSEAAQALQLAPNTVSTLVSRLVAAGLLERRPDRDDGRAARLRLTGAGSARVRRWRQHRTEVLARGLDTLDPGERAALGAAIEPLRRLAQNLEQVVPEARR